MNVNKAIFIDKDGTLIPDIPYNVDPDLITLSDKCIEGLRLLQEKGYLLIVITNQPGIALNFFDENQLLNALDKVCELLHDHGITIKGAEYCPHFPDKITGKLSCYCRKPLPGLLLRAAMMYDIDLSRSWMIGDILNDVEAGHRAGCKSILIANGNETDWMTGAYRTPDFIVANINEAADLIISHQEQRQV